MSGAELSDAGRVSDFGLQLDQLEGLCTEDYLLTNLTDPLQDSQVNQDSLSQQSNDFSPSKLEKPDSRKILSNRRAQQRFRVRQKAKKVEERTELQRLKQQVKDLEAQLNSANPGRDSSSLTQVCRGGSYSH